MSAPRLTAVDAQMLWLSAKIPNDTFLLFAFAGVPTDLKQALDELRSNAARCAELAVRIDQGNFLAYPTWERRDVDAAQFVVHRLEHPTWSCCLAAVIPLIDNQLDTGEHAWRLHVFPEVEGVPGVFGPGTVAVLQISHALGGGG